MAIELASARIRMLSPHALLERLEQSFELLRDGTRDLPERQKTLYSAIDWSYNLLRADEKRLLRRLSVFVGGWTFETADAVCNADSEQRIDIFAGLERLVDFNLIMPPQEVNGELRLKFLETIREFSMQRLVESGEAGRCGQAHGQFFLNLAEEAEPHLKGAQQTRWVARLEREHENLRGALEWALGAGKGEEGLRLAGALGRFWMTHGHLAEGRQWLKRTLEVGTGAPQGVRAKALRWAGALAWNQGDYARARRLYEEGLEILRELGDKQGIAIVLNNLGLVANSQGDYTEAGRLFEGSQAIYRELGDKWGIATTIVNLGLVSEVQEDYTGARRLFEESLAIHRQLGDKQGAAIVLINLGVIANKQGDHSGACNLFDESLTICHELGDKWGIANALDHLGLVMQVQGDQIQARKLHEESLVIRRDLGDKQGIADALSNLGIVAGSQGEYAAARRYIEESLVICRDLGDKQSIANALSGLASVMHAQEEKAEHAAQLQGAVTALIERLGVPLDQLVKADYKRTAAALQVKLGEGGYAAAFEAGRRFTLEEAVSLALTGPEPDTMTSQHR